MNLIASEDTTPDDSRQRDDVQYVVLPCEPKNFRGFIAGLLGKPQVTSGYVDGIFSVTANDVANIYHLVTQRVAKQNDSSLIHIAISVHYSDGHSVTHNTVEAFQNHHQTSDCYPVAISLSFSYLIKFIGREHPEKQEIGILITTDDDFRHEIRPDIWFQSGLFSYRINHTEVTWATDIAGLLKNHASTIVDKATPVKKFLARRADELLGHWFSLILLVALLATAYAARELRQTGAVSSPADASYLIVISFCSLLGLLVVLNSIERFFNFNVTLRYPSFITLTEKDKEHVAKVRRRQRWGWLMHGLAWVLGLVSGVLSNHIYAVLTRSLGT